MQQLRNGHQRLQSCEENQGYNYVKPQLIFSHSQVKHEVNPKTTELESLVSPAVL